MKLLVDDYDEELLLDPIKLCFDGHSNCNCGLSYAKPGVSNAPGQSPIQTIDLTGQSMFEDVDMPKPLAPKGAAVCYEIKQLAVQLVDFKKCPWYFKRYIKRCEDRETTKEAVGVEDRPDICMKIKYDNDEGQWKVHERNINNLPRRKDTAIPNTIVPRKFDKIDFKRNKGLVGMTITKVFKKKHVDSSLGEVQREKSDITDKPVDVTNDAMVKQSDGIKKEAHTELALERKTELPINYSLEAKVPPEDKNEDIVSISTEILENTETVKTQIMGILVAASKEHKDNSEESSQQKATNSCDVKDTFNNTVQLDTESTIISRNNNIILHGQSKPCLEQTQAIHTKTVDRLCDIKSRKLTGKHEIRECKEPYNSSGNKIPNTTSNANAGSAISNPAIISERQIPVIDSTSKRQKDFKKVIEKITKITEKLKQSENKETTCNNSKPLDMPVLYTDNDEKTVASSDRRMSTKESIVFENDLNSSEYLNNSDKSQENNTMPTVKKLLEYKNSIPVQESKRPDIIAANSSAVVPTTPQVVSKGNRIKNSTFKPRVKINPVSTDYSSSYVPTMNHSMQSMYSQSLLRYPVMDRNQGYNAQGRNMAPVLNAQSMYTSTAGISQHQLPVQQMSQRTAPPYRPYYTAPSGYATPRRDANITDYRTHSSSVNSNYYCNNMYSYSGLPPYPSCSPPQTQPQWPTNMTYNQNSALHTSTPEDSSIIGWNNGHVRKINLCAPKCNPPFRTVEDKRTVNVETATPQKHISNITDVRKLDAKPRLQIPLQNEVAKEKAIQQINGISHSSSKTTGLKRPYTKPIPEARRSIHLEADKEVEALSKRLKTSPLPVSRHVKALQKVATSTNSPPILPAPIYDNFLKSSYSVQPSRFSKVDAQRDSQARLDKRKMSAESLDYSKEICMKEKDSKNGSLFCSLVGRAVGKTGLKYAPKTLNEGNYNMDLDLGYSSDTTVKL